MSNDTTRVFVDTAAWIALFNTSDALHTQAVQTLQQLRRSKAQLVTTEFVLLEVADAMSAPPIRSQVIGFINGLYQWDKLQIIPMDKQLYDDAWNFYSQRLDKDWGLTDCTSFVVMMREQITDAFTSDRHFQQARFTKLL